MRLLFCLFAKFQNSCGCGLISLADFLEGMDFRVDFLSNDNPDPNTEFLLKLYAGTPDFRSTRAVRTLFLSSSCSRTFKNKNVVILMSIY